MKKLLILTATILSAITDASLNVPTITITPSSIAEGMLLTVIATDKNPNTQI